MGLADMLGYMGIPYDDPDAIEVASWVMKFITENAKLESRDLALEKGHYPEWRPGNWSQTPIRNSSVTTVAPTGTISRLAGCSSGIEPYYSPAWKSRLLWNNSGHGIEVYDCPRPLRERFEEQGIPITGELVEDIIGNPDKYLNPKYFRTAKDISWKSHVRILSALQPYVTNSISKTINMHASATVEDVNDAYWEAYNTGCKAVTIYRDGSRANQVLDDSKKEFPILEELKESEACQFCNGRLINRNGCQECESCGASRCDL